MKNQSDTDFNERSVFDDYTSPMYIMAKAAGAACNLDCKYCYYTEKGKLYPGQKQIMSDETLEVFVRSYIEAQTMPQVLFTWHGGEPLLRPLDFYSRAVKLQQYYSQGRQVDNCIQTNGTLLTDEWCRFLKENNWLVGLSIDGEAMVHDTYRRDHNDSPTHSKVMQAIELLNKYGVEWNAMAVVNNLNIKDPQGFYQFFKNIGCHYIQFTPIVERIRSHSDGRHLAAPDDIRTTTMTPESITADEWGEFLCTIFDEWVRNDVGDYYIQIFDATLANWVGEAPGICSLDKTCGHAGVMEYNGDVYSCDHFVFPSFKLGNVHTQSFVEMMYSERQLKFGQAKIMTLPEQCKKCDYNFTCHGECPKNRFIAKESGEPGLNYLCKGYYRFFQHSAPYMRFMRNELAAGRAPSNIMQYIN